jgi:hypothetical protein
VAENSFFFDIRLGLNFNKGRIWSEDTFQKSKARFIVPIIEFLFSDDISSRTALMNREIIKFG